jgi:PAT family beta-lactamase induction signal transducer AmpG
LKLINGIVMDRFAYLPMGRRRPWLIIGQGGIVLGLLAMASASPGPLDAVLLGAFAFAIQLWTTVQDVAVDGLAVDVIPEDELGRANGFMYGGQAIGIAAGASIAGGLLAAQGLPAAALALAAMVGLILLMVLCVRERAGERLLPWSAGEASAESLDRHLGALGPIVKGVARAMTARDTLLFLPALFLGGVTYGLFIGLAPLFGAQRLGWAEATYASWTGTANLVAGLSAVLLLGFAVERWGARRSFLLHHLLGAAMALLLFWLMRGGGGSAVLVTAIFAFTLLDNLRSVSGSAVAMRLSEPAVAATQFSLFMAVANLGISAASASLGTLDRLGGLEAMAAAIVGAGLLGAGFAAAAKVGR